MQALMYVKIPIVIFGGVGGVLNSTPINQEGFMHVHPFLGV